MEEMEDLSVPPTPKESHPDSLPEAIHMLTQSLTRLEASFSNLRLGEKTSSRHSFEYITNRIRQEIQSYPKHSISDQALSGDYSTDPVMVAIHLAFEVAYAAIEKVLEEAYGAESGKD